MKAVFLSDAHIKNREDKRYNNLLRFFDLIKNDIDCLFIVGDFFDFWFGTKDHVYPDFQDMIDKLIEIKRNGVEVYLFEGNHDFYLDDFFNQYNIKIFCETATINCDGIKMLISHGDTIDRSNIPYLRLRRILRSKVFYTIQKNIPRSILWRMAKISSRMSENHLAKPPDGLSEIMYSFSMEKFNDEYDAVIFGHYHQPMLKQGTIKGKLRTFATLGDWIYHYSYLYYDNGEFKLLHYKA